MASKSQFSVGTKVRYTHGKGLSTGEIISIEGDKATLRTVGGSEVKRLVKGLKKSSVK